MRNPTVLAAAAVLGGLGLFSCDVGTLAPQEPERGLERSDAPSSSSAVSPTAGLNASRTSGRGLDLDEEGCARSPGFWCHKKDGQLDAYIGDARALLLLEGVDLTEMELRTAVCDTRHQLLRHLTSLALNLAAGYVDSGDLLTGEDAVMGMVGDAFRMGAMVFLKGDAASLQERNDAKDVLDRINNNQNIDNACTTEPGEGEGPSTNGNGNASPAGGPPSGGPSPPSATACPLEANGKILVCHFPPGNPLKPQTLQISPSAWPAHEAHDDICGPCN